MILSQQREGSKTNEEQHREKSSIDNNHIEDNDTTCLGPNSHNFHTGPTTASTIPGSAESSTVSFPVSLANQPQNKTTMVIQREPESPHRQSFHEEADDTAILKQSLGSVSKYENEQHPNINSKAENHSGLDTEYLLQALDVLNGLAGMDSSDYQASLVETNGDISSSSVQVQNHLATTPQLLKLHQNIHRFHSLIRNLTAESDQQTMDLLEMHQQLQTQSERMAQLEEVVTKLHKRNTKLKARSKSSQSKARKLFQQVQEFTTNATKRKQQEHDDKLSMQVQHHEMIMMNRERTDSNFSDMDGLQDFDGGSDLDTVSTSSSVYDDGVATLKISRERTSTWPTVDSEDDSAVVNVKTKDEIPDPPNAYAATKERAEIRDARTERKTGIKHHNSNPFAIFLGPRPAHPYTLQFLEPFELQFVALLVNPKQDDTVEDNDKQKEETAKTAFAVCGYHGFDSYFNAKPTIGARLLQINKKELDPTWTVQDLEEHIGGLGSRATMTFRNETWSKSQKEALQMAIQEQERLHPETLASALANNPLMMNPFARKQRSQSSEMAAPSSSGTPSNIKDNSENSQNNKNLLGFLNFHGSFDVKKDERPPKSIKEGDRQQSAVTVRTSHNSPKPPVHTGTKSEYGNVDESNSPLNYAVTALCKNSQTSPTRPTEIHTTFSNDSSNEECFSFEGDQTRISLFMPMTDDSEHVVELASNTHGGAALTDREKHRDHARENALSSTDDWKPGCVLKLKGMPETTDRTAILQTVASHMESTVEEVKKFKSIKVDLVKGHATEAVVRFSQPDQAIAKLVESLNKGDLTAHGQSIGYARLLEGEEEEQYWKDFSKFEYDQLRQSSSYGLSSVATPEQAKPIAKSQDAGQKLKSSMKQMGKLFAFR